MFASHTMFGGGYSLVWASVARSLVRLFVLTPTTPWREWIEPHRIEWAQTREFFRFGLPMSVASIAGFGSQKFDNYVFAHHFGPGDCSKYNLAYNFADMPAALIAEQVGDVLVPSFARLEGEKRKEGLLLSIRMLVFLVAPLSIGLAMVAPALVKLAFTPEYDSISVVLRILAMFAIPRTIIWIGNSYLQVRNEPRTIMWLEIARMIGIVVFMHGFIVAAWAMRGPHTALRAACVSVVLVFSLSALSYVLVIRKLEGASLWSQLSPLVPPLLASAPMAAAVWGVSYLMWARSIFGLDHPIANQIDRVRVFGPRLIIEILVGAIVFVPSALILAPGPSRELLKLIREARTRRRKGEGEEAASEATAT
jgi:PST family polysaccharide transporter